MTLKMFLRHADVYTLTVQSQNTCISETPTLTPRKFCYQISFRKIRSSEVPQDFTVGVTSLCLSDKHENPLTFLY